MASNAARLGRRRRVLKEEVLSAGSLSNENLDGSTGDAPRYGVGANIENHPQVSDLVPRRFRLVALVLGLGLSVGVVAETAARYSEKLSASLPVVSAQEITAAFSNQLIAWASATLLLLTAGYVRLIFSLRRHRVDDSRGRYRIWRTASWAAIALSLNAVAGGHAVIPRALGYFTGWSVLPGNAGWGLAVAAILGGWILGKLIFDVVECRSALVAYMLALGCFLVAGACAAGWSPAWAASWPDTMGRMLPFAGHLMLLVGSLLFARYVVLDVQGLIEHHATSKQPNLATTKEPSEAVFDRNEEAVIAKISSDISSNALSSGDDSVWIDGTEMESEDESGGRRRLSKAERKRLRKQKSRNQAA